MLFKVLEQNLRFLKKLHLFGFLNFRSLVLKDMPETMKTFVFLSTA